MVKHYDVSMDAPAQAKFAASIAQGPGKVQGVKFSTVELKTRSKVSKVDYLNEAKESVGVKKGMEKEETDSEDDVPLVKLAAWRRLQLTMILRRIKSLLRMSPGKQVQCLSNLLVGCRFRWLILSHILCHSSIHPCSILSLSSLPHHFIPSGQVVLSWLVVLTCRG